MNNWSKICYFVSEVKILYHGDWWPLLVYWTTIWKKVHVSKLWDQREKYLTNVLNQPKNKSRQYYIICSMSWWTCFNLVPKDNTTSSSFILTAGIFFWVRNLSKRAGEAGVLCSPKTVLQAARTGNADLAHRSAIASVVIVPRRAWIWSVEKQCLKSQILS